MNSAIHGKRIRLRGRGQGFTLVEIMIVVAILGILIAIALPSFIRARNRSQRTVCVENLVKINEAKDIWAMEEKKNSADTPTPSDLYGKELFIKSEPRCPSGGSYTINNVGTAATCSLGDLLDHTAEKLLYGDS